MGLLTKIPYCVCGTICIVAATGHELMGAPVVVESVEHAQNYKDGGCFPALDTWGEATWTPGVVWFVLKSMFHVSGLNALVIGVMFWFAWALEPGRDPAGSGKGGGSWLSFGSFVDVKGLLAGAGAEAGADAVAVVEPGKSEQREVRAITTAVDAFCSKVLALFAIALGYCTVVATALVGFYHGDEFIWSAPPFFVWNFIGWLGLAGFAASFKSAPAGPVSVSKATKGEIKDE